MQQILYRGKAINRINAFRRSEYKNGDWVYGLVTRLYDECFENLPAEMTDINGISGIEIDYQTIGQFTGLTDKNEKKIFVGDIVQYFNFYGFECQAIVKLGKYTQDGSDGEYNGTDCIGFYVEVDNFSCPDWCGWDEDDDLSWYFKDFLWQQNILEVAKECEVVGNIFDDSGLLETSNG